ncbi:MAG: hypothetical protein ABJH85_07275 [Paracoccaceae bacterium]
MSSIYWDTCILLADDCVTELRKYESNVSNRWRDDVAEEIQWWWAWTLKLREDGELEKWGQFKSEPFVFEDYASQLDANEPVHVLNIGSGPRSTFGEASSAYLKVTNMDPLASAYNKLMALLGAPGTGDIVFGAVEI